MKMKTRINLILGTIASLGLLLCSGIIPGKAEAITFTAVSAQPHLRISPIWKPYRYVKVVGRQLLVDFDQNGIYTPYLIKGVGYSPYPIGRFPSDWGYPQNPGDSRPNNVYDDPAILNRDFPLLQTMHANTIRIWQGNNMQVTLADALDPTSPWYMHWSDIGRLTGFITQRTLDSAEQHHLKVIAGFWVDWPGQASCSGYTQYTNYVDPVTRQRLKDKFGQYVTQFRNHPAILFWALGNENNLALDQTSLVQINAYYSLLNEMAQVARQIEGPYYHPVAIVNGEIGDIGVAAHGTTDSQLNFIEIWGANVYRGNSFYTLFNDFAAKSAHPLWISEFGIDAWQSSPPLTSDPSGVENQSTQASWISGLWNEIANNTAITIGGSVMEYSDEWWKPYEWQCGTSSPTCNSQQNHFGFGPTDQSCPPDGIPDWTPPFPDQFINEEWFGIVKISSGTGPFPTDVVTPRQEYSTLQSQW